MAAYECIVQEGCTTLEQRSDLARELANIDEAILGAADDEITVEFIEMPLGSGFTGGQLSTTSIVIVEIPARCSYEIRKTLMSDICALWYDMIGCAADELVVFTTDAPRSA